MPKMAMDGILNSLHGEYVWAQLLWKQIQQYPIKLDICSAMKIVHRKFSHILKRRHYSQYGKNSKNTETKTYIYKLTI